RPPRGGRSRTRRHPYRTRGAAARAFPRPPRGSPQPRRDLRRALERRRRYQRERGRRLHRLSPPQARRNRRDRGAAPDIAEPRLRAHPNARGGASDMTHFRRILPLIALLAAGSPAAGLAQEAESNGPHEGLFATGVLDDLAIGESIRFRHARDVEPDVPGIIDFEGSAEVSIEEGEEGKRAARIALIANDQPRPVPRMPADAGHPLLLIFLENPVRTMSETVGGNPFYIRNRIRESFWDSGEVAPV